MKAEGIRRVDAPRRGLLLTVFLLANIAFWTIALLHVVPGLSNAEKALPRIAEMLKMQPELIQVGLYVSILNGLVSLVALMGVWAWKRWGVIVYVGRGLLLVAFEAFQGGSIGAGTTSLIGVTVLVLLVRKNWKSFR